MAILADQHIHTNHSFDSKTPMEAQVLSAIEKGLNHICFTDHNDFDYPVSEDFPEGAWELNTDSYLYELLSLREKYKDKIQIGFGIEIGGGVFFDFFVRDFLTTDYGYGIWMGFK